MSRGRTSQEGFNLSNKPSTRRSLAGIEIQLSDIFGEEKVPVSTISSAFFKGSEVSITQKILDYLYEIELKNQNLKKIQL